ncbi:hypothetical protein DXT99_09975 [Pontibacter diazotrophicus]|uniref:Uncharacterized protein n=1 Tax=Pontibacter diazotrophicus TaxID=1400979 RepID=A0A3D8LDJ8_9BACT|nr:hypothetical protein DXT99_09975 [Pontibacter diazotrophicus]
MKTNLMYKHTIYTPVYQINNSYLVIEKTYNITQISAKAFMMVSHLQNFIKNYKVSNKGSIYRHPAA